MIDDFVNGLQLGRVEHGPPGSGQLVVGSGSDGGGFTGESADRGSEQLHTVIFEFPDREQGETEPVTCFEVDGRHNRSA